MYCERVRAFVAAASRDQKLSSRDGPARVSTDPIHEQSEVCEDELVMVWTQQKQGRQLQSISVGMK